MHDRGSGSVWLLALATLVTALAVAAAAVAGAVTVRHRAATAADFAALAAASRAASSGDACATAGRLATANAARLTECHVEGVVVDVTATVRATGWLGRFGVASVRSARAGPVGMTPQPTR